MLKILFPKTDASATERQGKTSRHHPAYHNWQNNLINLNYFNLIPKSVRYADALPIKGVFDKTIVCYISILI